MNLNVRGLARPLCLPAGPRHFHRQPDPQSRTALTTRAPQFVSIVLITMLIGACTAHVPSRPELGRHLEPAPSTAGTIPDVVRQPPLGPPEPERRTEVYTVTVRDVPVRELLFVLARDAELNLDIHPEVSGNVTLNAVDQPLPQILARIARQVNLRFELERPNLIVVPDRPHLHTYKVDYVNLTRRSHGTVNVATQIATTGSGAFGASGTTGDNNSLTLLTQESANQFWDTLVGNVRGLLGATDQDLGTILVNRETGLLTVLATARQHEEIQKLLDQVLFRAGQQVLIEATVVEVELSDRYQAGVDWSAIDDGNDITFNQQTTGANLAQPPVTTLTVDRPGNLLANIKMLEQFGDLKVLSSPKVMALNNQTAMLKVVDNRVYFTVNVDIQAATATSAAITSYESRVYTVPVGFVMAVTPQISDTDTVSLNVRPTISRILGYVRDPSPALADAGVISEIPEIQVREIESVLKVGSGQIAVLGGLMQDSVNHTRTGIPGLSSLPWIGDLFSYRDDLVRKTELVIFLRPTVVRNASLEEDLAALRPFAPGNPAAKE